MVGGLASCIGDTRLLTILAYIKDYNPKLLVIIIIIISVYWAVVTQHITACLPYELPRS